MQLKLIQNGARRFLRITMVLAWTPLVGACLGSMVYPAPSYPVISPPPAPFREVRLRTRLNHDIVAWEYEFKQRPARGHRPAMLYLHGNGENLGVLHAAGTLEALARLQVSFAAPDYPGYGRSTGSPSRESLTEAGRTTLRHLGRRYPDGSLVVVGHSLGAGAAVQLALREGDKIAGMILISPFTSLRAAAAVHFSRCLAWIAPLDNYDSAAGARRIKIPVLVLHGFRDGLIPPEQGKTLARAFAGPTEYIEFPNVGHNDIVDSAETLRRMKQFMDAIMRNRLPVTPGKGLREDDDETKTFHAL